jgi:peptidoglycan/LPS O-acetylase OafA/YrhL
LTGLVGISVVLVALGNADGRLWSALSGDQSAWRGFVSTEAAAALLVAAGYLGTAELLRRRGDGDLDPVAFFGRFVWRWLPPVVTLCLALLIGWSMGIAGPDDPRSLGLSLANAAAGTFDLFLGTDLLTAWPGLSHLWVIGVATQWMLVLPLLVVLLGSRRLHLGLGLALVALALSTVRDLAGDPVNWIGPYSGPVTRGDAVLAGAAVACLVPSVQRWRGRSEHLVLGAGAACVALLAVLPRFGPLPALNAWGTAFVASTAVLVLGLAIRSPSGPVSRVLTAPPLRRLGEGATVLFVWHLPVILTVAAHTTEWGAFARIVACVAVLAAVVAAHRRWLPLVSSPSAAPSDRRSARSAP